MSITASSGPIISFGQGNVQDYNGQRAPSVFDQHIALMDPRLMYQYQPGQADASPVAGWMSGGQFVALDCQPSVLNAANIAASQSPGAGAIALVSVTGAGITAGSSYVSLTTGLTVSALAIDGPATRVSFGQTATVQLWSPVTCFGRAVSITSGGNDTGITFTVNGADVYGQPMSENMTGASGAAVTGKKAFKYITSVTHTGSVATTVTVGTTDIIGLPLRSDLFYGYTQVTYNGAIVTATTGYVAAVTTNPATAITGDVRGTYALQSAADGTKRLTVFQTISPANISSTTGLLGVTQFAA